jgi:hypothetical protein
VIRGKHILLDIEESKEVREFLQCLDALAKDIMLERCQDWFRKKLNVEEVEATYSPCHCADALGRRFVALQLSPNCALWSSPGRRAQVGDLEAGVEVVPVVSIVGLYFERKSFGLCLSVHEAVLRRPKTVET